MNPEEITIRKTPFLFLKWLVVIEFFLAILPFVIVTLANLRQNYDGTVLSRTVSYTFLVAIVLTTIQVLIISISFVVWYLPVYQANRQSILYRRSNLFEDKELIQTQSIERIEVRQGPLGRRLDYGTLAVYGPSSSDEVLVKDVPNPVRYQAEIESLISVRRSTAAPQMPASVEHRRFLDISFPELEGKQVCVVMVRPASQPAYLLYKGTEAFYIRAGNGSQALPMSKATSYIREHFER